MNMLFSVGEIEEEYATAFRDRDVCYNSLGLALKLLFYYEECTCQFVELHNKHKI